MKKISTLLMAGLLTMTAFAADKRPSVTVQAARNYEIVIDGRSYFSNSYNPINIFNLREGYHSITVYDVVRRFFVMKNRRVIASSSFMLRGKDVNIFISQFGQIQVKEVKKGRDRDGRDWNNDDRDNGQGNGNGNGYGQGQGQGQGNGYRQGQGQGNGYGQGQGNHGRDDQQGHN